MTQDINSDRKRLEQGMGVSAISSAQVGRAANKQYKYDLEIND